jgi:3-methylcrotonyl-CoA carboxylase alpha subunit
MEARLYAEDPAKGFLPTMGRIDILEPDYGSRFETGVEQGGEVTGFYDPMIAKIITHQSTREDACGWLAAACARTVVFPLKTNAPFLCSALEDEDFVAGRIDTGFIAAKGEALLASATSSADLLEDALVAILVQEYFGEPRHLFAIPDDHLSGAQPGPWRAAIGFRANAAPRMHASISVDGQTHQVALSKDWRQREVSAQPVGGGVAVHANGLTVLATAARTTGTSGGDAADGTILSPMPGRIIAVEVAAGDTVTKGQKLLTLEAMKMEHSLTSPFDGVVVELNAEAGAQVQVEALLVRIEAVE